MCIRDSASTEATWQWDKEPDLHDILAGKTFRILVENMESYTHADISFDRFGRIHVEPMTIGAFSPAESKADADDADTPAPEEPAVVDVRVWYELIGQKILTEQITELHAKGHSKPVSYTHLDVYKRQRLLRLNRQISPSASLRRTCGA